MISILENETSFIKARDKYDNLIIIDVNKLKYNERINGANIFKMLLGISDNNPYGNFGLEIDTWGYITLLKELQISCEDWNLLMMFLNKGKIPNYDCYKARGEYYTMVNNELEILNRICDKLGGIPSFDLFYENFHKDGEAAEKKRKGYDVDNPTELKEDEKKMFQWAQCTYYHSYDHRQFLERHKAGYGWNFTKQVKAIGNRGYLTAYYRREWKWVEYDEGETDSEEEEEEEEEEDSEEDSEEEEEEEEETPGVEE